MLELCRNNFIGSIEIDPEGNFGIYFFPGSVAKKFPDSHHFRIKAPDPKSGAKATALQTLREVWRCLKIAKRLDCGAFTADFPR